MTNQQTTQISQEDAQKKIDELTKKLGQIRNASVVQTADLQNKIDNSISNAERLCDEVDSLNKHFSDQVDTLILEQAEDLSSEEE